MQLNKQKTKPQQILPNPQNIKNEQNRYNTQKILLLGFSFFFIIGSYSVLRPLKSSVFLGLVGKEYLPIAKLFSFVILSPCLILYAKLVDKLRRYQVVNFFLWVYIIGTILLAFTLLHPVIGLSNTATSSYRMLGWVFYLFIDLYSPLVVTIFWAFANSINTPEYAKKSYGKIVAISRIGGIITSLFGWFIMQKTSIAYTASIPAILIMTSIFLLSSCICISQIIKKIPDQFLHGYQAAYEKEKQKKSSSNLLEGLKLILSRPYVLGIFGLVYIYEAISIITDYQMHVLMSIEKNNAIGGMSSFMFLYTATFQTFGLIFAFFGTAPLLKRFGVNFCLLIMPVATIIFMFGLLVYPSLTTIFIIMVLLRALHYGFNAPVREILYIPTTKDIKFKSKSWIDSFGRSLSKSSGSAFNLLSQATNSLLLIKINSIGAIAFSIIWALISFGLGKKYSKTIKNNEVIE